MANCVECKTQIPEGARLCATCKNYQPRWRRWLATFGLMAGFSTVAIGIWSLIGSVIVDLNAKLSWKEDVRAISFSDGEKVFLNAGDGKVFLSHVQLKDQRSEAIIPINKAVESKEFVVLESTSVGGNVVSGVSDEHWQELLDKLSYADYVDCIRVNYMYTEDSGFKLYESFLGDDLRTLSGEAWIWFYSSKDGQLYSTEFPVEGVLLKSDTEECRDLMEKEE